MQDPVERFKKLNVEGSVEVAEKVLEILADALKNEGEEKALELSEIFAHMKPSMRALEEIYMELRESRDYKLSLKKLREKLVENVLKTAKTCAHLLKRAERILTMSNSTTVYLSLKFMKRKPRVCVLESLPGGEGRVLKDKLKKEGFDAMLLPDSAVFNAVEWTEVILVGADSILEDFSVVNKIGTRTLAVISRYLGKPFFVVADPWKFGKKGLPKETVTYNGSKIPLFELVPSDLITAIITLQ
ncbi:MAG: translation initiation factor eIF-2B [Thermotogaceae bacterium]|nr:translation initiation factor eIF-2B [Thermotogaceae bacterium]